MCIDFINNDISSYIFLVFKRGLRFLNLFFSITYCYDKDCENGLFDIDICGLGQDFYLHGIQFLLRNGFSGIS